MHGVEIEHRLIARAQIDRTRALCRRQHLAQLLVARAGHAQRPRKCLEDGFDLVMIRAAVHRLHVHVGARAARKALKEIRHQLGLQIADQARAHLRVDGKGRAPAQIHGGNGQRLIHRHHEVSGAQNAALVAERAIEGLAERNAHVFHRVVLIDIEIAIALRGRDRMRRAA